MIGEGLYLKNGYAGHFTMGSDAVRIQWVEHPAQQGGEKGQNRHKPHKDSKANQNAHRAPVPLTASVPGAQWSAPQLGASVGAVA